MLDWLFGTFRSNKTNHLTHNSNKIIFCTSIIIVVGICSKTLCYFSIDRVNHKFFVLYGKIHTMKEWVKEKKNTKTEKSASQKVIADRHSKFTGLNCIHHEVKSKNFTHDIIMWSNKFWIKSDGIDCCDTFDVLARRLDRQKYSIQIYTFCMNRSNQIIAYRVMYQLQPISTV